MPSSASKQTEKLLDDVLRTIRQDYENPCHALWETDRNRFVGEEDSLRKQLKEAVESGSNSNLRSLFGLASPQEQKCLKDAQELRQRLRDEINAKLRTRLTGKSTSSPSHSCGQGSERMSETNAITEDSASPSSVITSPLNMPPSLRNSVVSEVDVNPAARTDHDYVFNISEAINSPLGTSSDSSDRSFDSSIRHHRRSPPPPPLRRTALSSESRDSSETESNSGSDSPRRSPSIRRPPPPPPQSPRRSRVPLSPTNTSISSPGSLPPDPEMISSITSFAQHMNTLASSIATQSLSSQAQGRGRLRYSEHVTKTNCVDIRGSNADGVTLNNGGKSNSGAVIHKTMVPPPRPRHPHHDLPF